MIIGAHMIIYSTQPDADRAFLRDHVKLPNVDAGDGWLIFGLPSAEVAVHPAERDNVHELYLMVEDVGALVAQCHSAGVACDPLVETGWGRLTYLTGYTIDHEICSLPRLVLADCLSDSGSVDCRA